MWAGVGGWKGCGLVRGAGAGVDWPGDRKWCRLVREAGGGVDCCWGQEGVWTAEGGMKGCELLSGNSQGCESGVGGRRGGDC